MKCPKCGADNQTTRFCGECGNQLVFEDKVFKDYISNDESNNDDKKTTDDNSYINHYKAMIGVTVLAFLLSFTKLGLLVGFVGVCIVAVYVYNTLDTRITTIVCITVLAISLLISALSFEKNKTVTDSSKTDTTNVAVDQNGADRKKIDKIEKYISKGSYDKASKLISELGLDENDPERIRLKLDVYLAQGFYNGAAKIIFDYSDSIEDKSLLADDEQFNRLNDFLDKLNTEYKDKADKLINDVNIAKIESVSGHDWIPATCTEPKICKLCGITEGNSLGHDWKEATCTTPETCSRCGETQGDVLEHECEEWKVEKKATCSEEGLETGVCLLCEEEVSRPIPKTEHVEGDWEISYEATDTASGAKVKRCKVCGEQLAIENYYLTDEEKIEYYKKKCESVSYDDLIRYPDKYENTPIKVTCKIQEVDTVDSWIFEDQYIGILGGKTVSIVDKRTVKEPKLRAGDSVTIYGTGGGYTTEFTYQKGLITGLPKNIETEKIPCINMQYVSIK